MKRPLRSAANDAAAETHPWAVKRASAQLSGFFIECLKSDGRWQRLCRCESRQEAEQARDYLISLGQKTRLIAST
jgi:hypothetical protein